MLIASGTGRCRSGFEVKETGLERLITQRAGMQAGPATIHLTTRILSQLDSGALLLKELRATLEPISLFISETRPR